MEKLALSLFLLCGSIDLTNTQNFKSLSEDLESEFEHITVTGSTRIA